MMRRLLGDQRGVSIVEFALCLPFMLLLYIGGYQLSDATAASRKVTIATRTVADITSQYTSVSNNDLDTILNACTQVMFPYKISSAKIIVSQIYTDANGNSTVSWSRGKNISGLSVGSEFSLPDNVKQPNGYLIVASIDYTYTPVAARGMIGTIPIRDQIIMGARASTQVKFRA